MDLVQIKVKETRKAFLTKETGQTFWIQGCNRAEKYASFKYSLHM